MDLLDISLIFSTLSCSLLTGFIFTYAIVVMPGLSNLKDKEFIRAFQVTDAVIQNNQPLFMLTWVGSIVSLLSTILISIVGVGLSEAWLIVLMSVFYLLGVQGITIAIHIPLNNHIQNIDVDKLDDQTLSKERIRFETRWVSFNKLRTGIGVMVTLLYLLVLIIR